MAQCCQSADPSGLLSRQESEIENSHYHEQNLVNSLMNLFAAGTDTTALTLQWCLLFMAKFPHFQGAETLRRAGLTIAVLFAIAPKSFLGFSALRPGPGGADEGGGKPSGPSGGQEEPAVH